MLNDGNTTITQDSPPNNGVEGPPDESIYDNIGRSSKRNADRVVNSILHKFGLKNKHSAHVALDATSDPRTYAEAPKRPDAEEWIDAMQEELNSLEACGVIELVEPPNLKVVSVCRCVFKTKRAPDGQILRYRARLMARGLTQENDVDYHNTYARVCDITSVRLLFAYAAKAGLLIRQYDIKNAFLNGELHEQIFMEQPPGQVSEEGKHKVYRLHKAIYGLKQASHQWYQKFSSILGNFGMRQCSNDDCIFIQQDPLIIVAIYVDDLLVLAKDLKTITVLYGKLKKSFDVHQIDNRVILGFQYEILTDGSIFLHQESYISRIILHYNMSEANIIMSPEADDSKHISESKPLDHKVPIGEAIGKLLYAAMTSRPHIAHAVIRISQVKQPSQETWTAIKRIIRYLKRTNDFGIRYRSGDFDIIGYTDANFAGDKTDIKSTTGFIFKFADGPIC